MTKGNSLLVGITLSLTEEQINSCFQQFKEASKELMKKGFGMPQVEFEEKEESAYMRLIFKPISDSYMVNAPSINIQLNESCKNMETVKAVKAEAHNCGMCRGGSSVSFNAKNYGKFEQVLTNMMNLFSKNYEETIKEDKIQVEFATNVQIVRTNFKTHEEENKRKNMVDYLGSVRGEIRIDEQEKTYGLEIGNLSFDQIMKLQTIVPNL